jgi:hypothetical protein
VSTAEGLPFAYANVAAFVPTDPSFTLLSVIQSGMDSGAIDVVDSMEASYMVTGRPGTFSIETPLVYENVPDLQAQADLIYEYIVQGVAVVQQLYAL